MGADCCLRDCLAGQMGLMWVIRHGIQVGACLQMATSTTVIGISTALACDGCQTPIADLPSVINDKQGEPRPTWLRTAICTVLTPCQPWIRTSLLSLCLLRYGTRQLRPTTSRGSEHLSTHAGKNHHHDLQAPRCTPRWSPARSPSGSSLRRAPKISPWAPSSRYTPVSHLLVACTSFTY